LSHPHRPSKPHSFATSELLHGDDEGFIINAYLAMQRHWPDDGGYQHYLYQLYLKPGIRASILRELARAETARAVGVELVDDLPPDHVYDPLAGDLLANDAIYQAVSHRLRLLQVVYEISEVREAISRMSLEGLSAAVKTIVDTSMNSLAHLESRISTLEEGGALPRVAAAPLANAGGGENTAQLQKVVDEQAQVISALRREVRNLIVRMRAVEAGGAGVVATAAAPVVDSDAIQGMKGDIQRLKDTVGPLHHFATVDLKKQMADYVNAMIQAYMIANAPPTESAKPAGTSPQAGDKGVAHG